MNSNYYLEKITKILNITTTCNTFQEILELNVKNIKPDYNKFLLALRINDSESLYDMKNMIKKHQSELTNRFISIDLLNNYRYNMWIKLCKEAIKLNKSEYIDEILNLIFFMVRAYKNNIKSCTKDWIFDYIKNILDYTNKYNNEKLASIIDNINNWHTMIYHDNNEWEEILKLTIKNISLKISDNR
jgi:hypothetical protein